jgi:hypothetical protein
MMRQKRHSTRHPNPSRLQLSPTHEVLGRRQHLRLAPHPRKPEHAPEPPDPNLSHIPDSNHNLIGTTRVGATNLTPIVSLSVFLVGPS